MTAAGSMHPVVVDPLSSAFLEVPEGVRLIGSEETRPGVTFPRGFLAGGFSCGLKGEGRLDLALLAVTRDLREGASSAAVFTRNSFAAAPVLVSRRASLGRLVGLVINSGNANACSGPDGLETARRMQAALARSLGVEAERIGVASTGIIGVALDATAVLQGIEAAVSDLGDRGGAAFAESIMTTDRFPKSCALEIVTRDGLVRVGAAAKGAGMIAPGMATMICAATTDAVLAPNLARSLLTRAVGRSFHRISVDGQMSTNDCVFLLASGASGTRLSAEGVSHLERGLRSALQRMALMIVADGEGATKVVRLRLRGARSDEEAQTAARSVANSPLVKAAMYGRDPNWGRILAAVGGAVPGTAFPGTSLEIGGVRLAENAAGIELGEEAREHLRVAMRESEVDILLDLGAGPGSYEVYFSDLTHDYVTLNAEYHT